MKWSLNTYQIGQDWELDYLIDIVKKTGYHGIEFLMDFNQKHGLEWNTVRNGMRSK
jgi:sugar phosphate isomerase/epimerase